MSRWWLILISPTDEFSPFELTLCADPSWWIRSQIDGVQSVQACVGYKRHSGLWFYPRRPPSFIYLYQLSHRFNVMLVLTVFGQSQSSVMTIGCEWISWIHGVQWPQSKQTGGRGPSLASCRSADAPQRGRYPRYCIDWEWYVVGTWRKNVCPRTSEMLSLELNDRMTLDLSFHFLL